MAEHENVDSAVPRWQALVERDEEPRRIRTAVDDQPAAPPALDQDPIALADVEHDDAGEPVRAMDEHEGEANRRDHQRSRGQLHCPVRSRRRAASSDGRCCTRRSSCARARR
jgi:hypothetical protein